MAYEFKNEQIVEFSQTDAAGIIHFSSFFFYMEVAEHAFYRSLGFSVFTRGGGEGLSWPRVSVSCDFRLPLQFEDVVEVHLLVREIRAKSIAYTFIFRKKGEDPMPEVARGSLTIVCARKESGERLRSVAIPGEILAKIQEAPRELLESAKRLK